MEQSREDLLFIADISEQAEKYNDMLAALTLLVQQHPVLTTEERNLLSVAFKNTIGSAKYSHRIISSLEAAQTEQNNEKNIVRIRKYREKIENEIRHYCRIFLDMLENILIPNAQDHEFKVFYYKMQGDYWRYLAEIELNEQKKYATDRSKKGYDIAFKLAENLSLLRPIRLGLCLNYLVFCHEILTDKIERIRALEITRKMYNDVTSHIDNASEEELRDLEPILRLFQTLPPFPDYSDEEQEESQFNPESGHVP